MFSRGFDLMLQLGPFDVDFHFVHLLRVILFLVSSTEEVPEDVVESEQEIGALHDGEIPQRLGQSAGRCPVSL